MEPRAAAAAVRCVRRRLPGRRRRARAAAGAVRSVRCHGPGRRRKKATIRGLLQVPLRSEQTQIHPPKQKTNPPKTETLGIESRTAPGSRISVGGRLCKPSPALGDHPRCPPGVLTVRPLLQAPSQVEAGSMSVCVFCSFWTFPLGSRPDFLATRPYFRVCVLVAVLLSTETFLRA